jgi:hypothetical protein
VDECKPLVQGWHGRGDPERRVLPHPIRSHARGHRRRRVRHDRILAVHRRGRRQHEGVNAGCNWPQARGLHSLTFQLNVSTFRILGSVVLVGKTGQVEMLHGLV